MRSFTIFSLVLSMLLVSNLSAQDSQKKQSNSPKYFGWVVPNFVTGASANAHNSFNMRMARFGIKGKYDDKIGYHMMGDLINVKTKAPVFVQGWLEYYMPASTTLRVGQFKYNFGQETLPAYMLWKFANPSYVAAGIGGKLGRSGSMFRDIGAQLSSKYSFSETTQLYGSAMIMNGQGANVLDDDKKKDFVLNGGIKLPMNLEVGASYYTGAFTDANGATLAETATNIYLKAKTKKFVAQAEYMTGDYKNADETSAKPAGFYAYAAYRVISELELGLRYDSFESDTNKESTDMNRTTFAATYYFNKMNRIMLNYELLGGEKNTGADDLITMQFYLAI